jgi:hypothetical protein
MARRVSAGKGRYTSAKPAKVKGAKSLPPRKTGKSKIVQANPMAHGGNC